MLRVVALLGAEGGVEEPRHLRHDGHFVGSGYRIIDCRRWEEVWHEAAPVNAINKALPPFGLLEMGGKKALQRVKPWCRMQTGRTRAVVNLIEIESCVRSASSS